MKNIFTILILCGLSSVAFASDCTRDNTNETVNCTDTGLMWQDDSNASSVSRNWQGAIDHCEGLDFAGYDDWRLPNYNELESIVDYDKTDPAIDSAFQNTNTSNRYWSSTSYASSPGNAWFVDFDYGNDYWLSKSNSRCVRCVRAGQ